MHTSVSGSVDRNLYAILEQQAMLSKQGSKAAWPVWLAPTQVRLLPVSDDHLDGALALADLIPHRVDVDDRNEKIGRKVRDSEKEWVPYTLVIGAKEVEGADLTVRLRSGEQIALSLPAFLERLAADTAGKPTLGINTPRLLSRRPIFVG
jgi:threonyl-tRNA synthetase